MTLVTDTHPTAGAPAPPRTPGPLAHRKMGHIAALDGLRGIAVAFVFLVHLYAPVFSGGGTGVDLFFVLSGFLITKLMLEERQATEGFSRRDFYLRRAFRILPPLLVLMAAMLVASFTILHDVGGVLRREVIFATFSGGNLWPLFYGFEPRTALAHTWSLGFEEQFYLIWPFILSLAMAAGIGWKRITRGLVVFSAAMIVVGRVVVAWKFGYPHWGSIPVFDFDGLALGCVLALLVHYDDDGRVARFPKWLGRLGAAFMAAWLFVARFFESHDHYNMQSLVARAAFAAILLWIVNGGGPAANRFLEHPWLNALGRWSYSLYLWHVPVFYILSKERYPALSRPMLAGGRVFGAFAAALASYYLVERPMLRVGRRYRARRTGEPVSAGPGVAATRSASVAATRPHGDAGRGGLSPGVAATRPHGMRATVRDAFGGLAVEITTLGATLVSFALFSHKLGPNDYGSFIAMYSLIGVAICIAYIGPGLALLQRGVDADLNGVAGHFFTVQFVLSAAAFAVILAVKPVIVPAAGYRVFVCFALAELIGTALATTAANLRIVARGYRHAVPLFVAPQIVKLIVVVTLAVTDHLTLVTYSMVYLGAIGASGVVAFLYVTRQLHIERRLRRLQGSDVRSTFSFSSTIWAMNIHDSGDKLVMSALQVGRDLGLYGAAYRVVQLGNIPVNALATSSYRAFLDPNSGSRTKRALRMTLVATVYTVCATGAIIVAAPLAVRILAGREFSGSVVMARWLAPLLITRGMLAFASNALAGLGRLRARLRAHIASAIVGIVVYLALIPWLSWKGAIIGSYVTDFVLVGTMWGMLLRSRHEDLDTNAASGAAAPGHRIRTDATGRAAVRVAYLTSYYPAVSHSFIRREVVALREQGVEVTTFGIRAARGVERLAPEDQAEAERTRYIRGRGAFALGRDLIAAIAPHPFAFTRVAILAVRQVKGVRPRAWQAFYVAEAAILRRWMAADGITHVHAHFGNAPADVARWTRALGNRIGSGWSWSFTMHGSGEFYAVEENRLAEKVADADLVVCISDYTRSQLMLFSPPEHWDKLVVVHCGVVPEEFIAARAEQDGLFRIVCVGRLVEGKGQTVLLRAARRLGDMGIAARVVIVGDGPARAGLEAEAARLGVGTFFTGPVGTHDVARLLAVADVFCLPSFAEGIPVVLMEAMASGLPVVATRITGIPELVEDGVSGFTVTPGRDDVLADALAVLARDHDLAHEMGAAGRATVRRDFDVRGSARQLAMMFCDIADGTPMSASRASTSRSWRTPEAFEARSRRQAG